MIDKLPKVPEFFDLMFSEHFQCFVSRGFLHEVEISTFKKVVLGKNLIHAQSSFSQSKLVNFKRGFQANKFNLIVISSKN